VGKVYAEGDHPRFDVLWVEGSAVMSHLGREKILKPEPGLTTGIAYTALGRRLIPASHFYAPISVTANAIEVNTRKLGKTPPPASWSDLTRFAGFVAAKDPNLSGPAYQWLAGYLEAMGAKKGKAELEKILTNKALSGLPSGEDVNRAVISGDAKVAIQQDSAIYNMMAEGEPVEIVYPRRALTAIPACAGISAGTRHEAEARAFIRFLLSRKGQEAMLTTTGDDGYFAPIIKGVQGKGHRLDNTAGWQLLDRQVADNHEKEWKRWYHDRFVP
jgi:iron(III) transport system substrate-binding protein